MRRLTLIVPNDSREQHNAHETFETRLTATVEGYSRYGGAGIWKGVREVHLRYEILYDAYTVRVELLKAFYAYGRDAGEHTLLWWDEEVNAHFVEVEREAASVPA